MLALELPHSEFLGLSLLLFIIGVGLLAIARFWPESKKGVVTAVWPVKTRRIETVPLLNVTPAEAGAESGLADPLAPFARVITWPALIDPDAGALSTDERLRVIEGLGIAATPGARASCARPTRKRTTSCASPRSKRSARAKAPTWPRSWPARTRSNAVPERYAAIDGASRRGDVALLKRALHDSDGTVALAAAYGLHRAKRPDLIERGLAGRTDPRADEIRRVLPDPGVALTEVRPRVPVSCV